MPQHPALCTICNSTKRLTRLNWLRDGEVVLTTTFTMLAIIIDGPTLDDAGQYSCQAVFTDGSRADISAGFLNLFREYLWKEEGAHAEGGLGRACPPPSPQLAQLIDD